MWWCLGGCSEKVQAPRDATLSTLRVFHLVAATSIHRDRQGSAQQARWRQTIASTWPSMCSMSCSLYVSDHSLVPMVSSQSYRSATAR